MKFKFPTPWGITTGAGVTILYDAAGDIVCDNHPYDTAPVHPDAQAIIARAVNSHAALVEAIEHVRAIIADASTAGFNPKSGNWADRLFASQALTFTALAKAKESE